MLNFTVYLMSQTSVHSRVHIFIIIREIKSPEVPFCKDVSLSLSLWSSEVFKALHYSHDIITTVLKHSEKDIDNIERHLVISRCLLGNLFACWESSGKVNMWFTSKGFPKYLVEIDIKITIYMKQVFTILNIIVDMLFKKHGRTKAFKNLLVF